MNGNERPQDRTSGMRKVFLTPMRSLRRRLLPLALLLLAGLVLAPAASADDDPFAGNGMWIWQVPKAAGGDPAGIIEQAQAANIDTLFIKSAHGPTPWSQFSPELVATLKAAGLHVCGYQRLLGTGLLSIAHDSI